MYISDKADYIKCWLAISSNTTTMDVDGVKPGLWTTILKPGVWQFGCHHLCFVEPKVTISANASATQLDC